MSTGYVRVSPAGKQYRGKPPRDFRLNDVFVTMTSCDIPRFRYFPAAGDEGRAVFVFLERGGGIRGRLRLKDVAALDSEDGARIATLLERGATNVR